MGSCAMMSDAMSGTESKSVSKGVSSSAEGVKTHETGGGVCPPPAWFWSVDACPPASWPCSSSPSEPTWLPCFPPTIPFPPLLDLFGDFGGGFVVFVSGINGFGFFERRELLRGFRVGNGGGV